MNMFNAVVERRMGWHSSKEHLSLAIVGHFDTGLSPFKQREQNQGNPPSVSLRFFSN